MNERDLPLPLEVKTSSNTDYTADVVRVKVHDALVDMAKVGATPPITPSSNVCGEGNTTRCIGMVLCKGHAFGVPLNLVHLHSTTQQL